MKVLIIKTSSMGDIIHTMPAITDAVHSVNHIKFDWVVEESFEDIALWHPAVENVIPVAMRRWRRNPIKALLSGEWSHFKKELRDQEYDCIIDAQGLIKSAFITRRARGISHGLDKASAREPSASRAYQYVHFVPKKQHAIQRVRKLFADSLHYPMPESRPDYGLDKNYFTAGEPQNEYAVFLHGTTWPSKHWPEQYWKQLAEIVVADGRDVFLPWGSETEKKRADFIAHYITQSKRHIKILPEMDMNELAKKIAGASFVVGVDTGLAHLAAALGVPSVTLYGSTRADLTGTMGNVQKNLEVNFECAPCLNRICVYKQDAEVQPACYQTLSPEMVWAEINKLLESNQQAS